MDRWETTYPVFIISVVYNMISQYLYGCYPIIKTEIISSQSIAYNNSYETNIMNDDTYKAMLAYIDKYVLEAKLITRDNMDPTSGLDRTSSSISNMFLSSSDNDDVVYIGSMAPLLQKNNIMSADEFKKSQYNKIISPTVFSDKTRVGTKVLPLDIILPIMLDFNTEYIDSAYNNNRLRFLMSKIIPTSSNATDENTISGAVISFDSISDSDSTSKFVCNYLTSAAYSGDKIYMVFNECYDNNTKINQYLTRVHSITMESTTTSILNITSFGKMIGRYGTVDSTSSALQPDNKDVLMKTININDDNDFKEYGFFVIVKSPAEFNFFNRSNG